MHIIAICVGACTGALLRWALSLLFNPSAGQEPAFTFIGTLLANWLGAYCIGFAWAYFVANQAPSPTIQLFVITGMLGALTTFSTFSLEVVNMLLADKWMQAIGTVGLHVIGSLLLTYLGIKSYQWLINYL